MPAYLSKKQIIDSLPNMPPQSFKNYAYSAKIFPVSDALIVEREAGRGKRIRKFFADGYPLDSVERIKEKLPERYK